MDQEKREQQEQQQQTQQEVPQQPNIPAEQINPSKPTTEPSEQPKATKPARRFLAQPVETTSRSSKPSPSHNEAEAAAAPPRRRFLPEPIETTRVSHSNSTKLRRFKPEIIETEFRSVGKDSDSNSRHAAQDRDHLGVHVHAQTPGQPRLSPSRAISNPNESRFSYANLLRRQEQTRRHSFRVPELPSIASNSSGESEAESEAVSVSVSPAPEKQERREKRTRKTAFAESEPAAGAAADGSFDEYMLSVAARSAHQQLKDQALAAFPNEQAYQHFDHFAIDDEAPSRNSASDEDWMYPPKHHLKSRRQSSADLSWELEYMRHHKEEAEQRFRIMKRKPDLKLSGPRSTKEPLGPSPPMLGGDIILPQSLSPVGTFSNNNGEDSNPDSTDPCTGCGTLWCGPSRPDNRRGTGLWMGTCQKDEDNHSQLMTGLMTPMRGGLSPNPSPSLSPSPSINLSPASASASAAAASVRDPPRSIPRTPTSTSTTPTPLPPPTNKQIEEEFNDSFVTQIYNYLSLGYPCVARYYDHELSKISGIKIEDMREDDLHTDARGYVVAPEADLANATGTGTASGDRDRSGDAEAGLACMRWKALRLYIQEWARQQPSMIDDKRWGVPERRGSWAF